MNQEKTITPEKKELLDQLFAFDRTIETDEDFLALVEDFDEEE